MFSGGALSALLFSLVYNAVQSPPLSQHAAGGIAVPQLEQLKKEGEAGRRKMTQYTRYGTWIWQ